MSGIPSNINGVAIDFSPAANSNVDQRIVDALLQAIRPDIAPEVLVETVR